MYREQCSFHDIYYSTYRDSELSTKIKYVCDICGYSKWIDKNEDDKKIMSINEGAVIGTIASGSGYSELKQQLGAMAIPCMSSDTYRKYRQNLVETFEKAADECMQEAAKLERELAFMNGDTYRWNNKHS